MDDVSDMISKVLIIEAKVQDIMCYHWLNALEYAKYVCMYVESF